MRLCFYYGSDQEAVLSTATEAGVERASCTVDTNYYVGVYM